ncbi:MAG TPA: porin family protein [Flavisolibacter sp.]|nr:porin family protein [Flavisolibacter sp.]
MKKILFAAFGFAALTFASNTNAQQGFSLNVKATPQFSFLQNSGDKDNSSVEKKANFNAAFGVGAGYNFNGTSGIGLDVIYSLQGQRYEAGSTEVNQKLNYIKIPVYYTFNTDASKPVSFIAKVGPQLSLLTSAKVSDKDGNEIVSDNKDAYENATFGGVIGAGVQFKLNKSLFLTTNARFDYDFTNAENENYSSYPAGRAATNNMTTGLEVGLKYLLR